MEIQRFRKNVLIVIQQSQHRDLNIVKEKFFSKIKE